MSIDSTNVEVIVASLAPLARDWIVAQRERYRPRAVSLPQDVISAVAPFYSSPTLHAVRYAEVDKLENPPFYAELQRAAPDMPLIDFGAMDGITFDDTIVLGSHGSGLISLFFHELAHVVQYSILRPSAFAARYVRGWASNGMQYENIPLERDAYALQGRFDSGSAPFSAEEAIAGWLSSRTAT